MKDNGLKRISLTAVLAMACIITPFRVTAQEQVNEPTSHSNTSDDKTVRRRGFVGLGMEYFFSAKAPYNYRAIGKVISDGENFYDKTLSGRIDAGYLFSNNWGVTAACGLITGIEVGPMLSINPSERLSIDLRPMYIVWGNGSGIFDICASVNVNLSSRFSLSGNVHVYPNLYEKTVTYSNGVVESSDYYTTSIIGLALNANYRLGLNYKAKRKIYVFSSDWLQKKNKFGVKAGMNIAWATHWSAKSNNMTVTNDQNTTYAFHLGFFDNYSLSNNFGMQFEALYSHQGNGNNTFGYLNFPVLLDVRPVQKLSILVGTQLGFNIIKPDEYNETYYLSGTGVFDFGWVTQKDNQQTNLVDFSLVIGAQLPIIEHLVIGARYNHGLTPIRKFSNPGIYNLTGYANRVVQFSIGWFF